MADTTLARRGEDRGRGQVGRADLDVDQTCRGTGWLQRDRPHTEHFVTKGGDDPDSDAASARPKKRRRRQPIVAEEHIVQRLPVLVAERFRPRPDYLLTVRGDSMDRTGVRDRDVVAIRKTNTAKSGQVVVARFGDEVTLKRFVQIDERHVELRPESYNPAHEVMKLDLAKHILHIEGVAVGAMIWDLRDAQEDSGEGDRPERLRRLKTKGKL